MVLGRVLIGNSLGIAPGTRQEYLPVLRAVYGAIARHHTAQASEYHTARLSPQAIQAASEALAAIHQIQRSTWSYDPAHLLTQITTGGDLDPIEAERPKLTRPGNATRQAELETWLYFLIVRALRLSGPARWLVFVRILNGWKGKMTTYFIEKSSDTWASTLLVVGFAELLDKVLPQEKHTSPGILLKDAGPYYQVEMPEAIDAADLQRFQPCALLQPLETTSTLINRQLRVCACERSSNINESERRARHTLNNSEKFLCQNGETVTPCMPSYSRQIPCWDTIRRSIR